MKSKLPQMLKIYTKFALSYFSYLPNVCMYVNWTKSTTKEISQNIWEAQSRVITEIRIGCKASNLSLRKSLVENCKLYGNSLFRIQSWPDTYYIPQYANTILFLKQFIWQFPFLLIVTALVLWTKFSFMVALSFNYRLALIPKTKKM